MLTTHIQTPVGNMIAAASDDGICLFDFEFRKSIDAIKHRISSTLNADFQEGYHPYFDLLKTQIREYFDGTRKNFDLPLHLVGTDFQKRVWKQLIEIPYGSVSTYKKQAIALGNEKAIRAMAKANAENGLAIIVPCHRVISEAGHLTGYGGGLPKKKWLIEHERKHVAAEKQFQLF